MSESDLKKHLLILRQRPGGQQDLDDLLKKLQARFDLDPYMSRQRLIGQGLALFDSGQRLHLAKIAVQLREYGYPCWLVEDQPYDFEPDLLRSLEIHPNEIILVGQTTTQSLVRDSKVIAVLADISGGLVDRQVKRLLARESYRGHNLREVFSREELIQTVLNGQPIFEWYAMNLQNEVSFALQAMPGRFNIDGLGGRATLSATQNLKALVDLVAEYAGDFQLHCDFGLGHLPFCQVDRLSANAGAAVQNLQSLSRYRWLVTQIKGDGITNPVSPQTSNSPVEQAAGLFTVATAGLGAGLQTQGSGDLEFAIETMLGDDRESEVDQGIVTEKEYAEKDLPAPPERPPVERHWQRVLFPLAAFVAATLLTVNGQGNRFVQLFIEYGVSTGIAPGLLAAFSFWGGLYFTGLKRHIENTPTSKIRSMAMGMVEIHGRARRLYALVSPMTQRSCVWYRLRTYRKDNKNRWKLVRQINSNHVPFQIDDGTGRVVVDPNGASIEAKTRQTGFSGPSNWGSTSFQSSTDRDEKWVEDIVYEGTSLYVMGFAQPLKKQRVSLRDRVNTILQQLKLDRQAMHRYDTNGDGQVDGEEWQAARRDAERDAIDDMLSQAPQQERQGEPIVVTRPTQQHLPFIIAEALCEKDLSRKYGWFSLPCFVAGAAASGWAVLNLLEYLQH